MWIIKKSLEGWAVVEAHTGVSVGPFRTERAAKTYLRKMGVNTP